jgi:DNA-binding NarL/FixJ family response regulator
MATLLDTAVEPDYLAGPNSLAVLLAHASQALAIAGQALVAQSAAREIASAPVETRHPREPVARPQLSPRERELLGLVGRGFTDREIANELVISLTTVHSHLDRIRDKTGRRRRPHLTRLALELNLVVE